MASSGSAALWYTTHPIDYRNPLSESVTADVCVVGAGITGLTTAYLLSLEGLSVVVVEGAFVGHGMTGRSSAHLSNIIDDRLAVIERIHGLDGLRLAAASHRSAIETVSRIVCREHIECDFEYVDGYLFQGRSQGLAGLRAEEEAALRAGIEVQFQGTVPIAHFHTGPCLRFPYQAQFHPLAYLAGLLSACQRQAVKVYTGAHVRTLECHNSCMVRVQNGSEVRAADLVVATNVPINVPLNLHLKQSAWMTFMVGALVPRGSVARILLWDMEVPYHYVRVQPLDDTYDILLVGGEDRRTGQQAEDDVLRYERLKDWTRERFPMCAGFPYRWSGQIMETSDGLAFIGRNMIGHPNVYIATGDSGMGLTHGTIAGLLITDLIAGRDNPWAGLYHPLRLPLRSLGTVLKEDAAMAARYSRWADAAEVDHPGDIPVGEGRLLTWQGHKVAAYKAPDQEVHMMSAVCPHLGGMVTWNNGEKTWDCACHGSRFSCFGQVIGGPAKADLEPLSNPVPVL